ncbi:MAG: RNA polymerase sigma factor [Calditrichaeota bacterium]|nr:RNA polymerase sigma factor [Calditrichota bacterium]
MGGFDERRFLEEYQLRPERAFGMLMEAFRDRIFLLCLRASGSRQQAEDLAQETFIRVWKGLPRFRGDSSLATWIYHIAWNVCASYIEEKSRSATTVDITDEALTASEPERLSGADPGYRSLENRQFVAILMAQLPKQQQLALTLYYLQELSYDEISRITNWPMGTVKATLFRAKERMREAALKEMGRGYRPVPVPAT